MRQIVHLIGRKSDSARDGVADYFANLSRALAGRQNMVLKHLEINIPSGSILSWINGLRALRRHSYVHMQYPMEGWGHSILPGIAIFFLRVTGHCKIVVTLHEWSHMHRLRKLSLWPVVLFSDKFVFVSKREASSFEGQVKKFRRLTRDNIDIIPIGANVATPRINQAEVEVVRKGLLGNANFLIGYFGFIYPAKQPLKMLEVIHVMREMGLLVKLVLCGEFAEGQSDLKNRFNALVEELGLSNQVLQLGYICNEQALATQLAACNVNLQLYDDGLSARRGSFWYAVDLGLKIVTTNPLQEDEFHEFTEFNSKMDSFISFVDINASPQEIAKTILCSYSTWELPTPRALSPNWGDIGKMHEDLYLKI